MKGATQHMDIFPLGRTVGTPGAITRLAENNLVPITFLRRHASGDWGDLDLHDKTENERSLAEGMRLLSSYVLGNGKKIWIITEADRSLTTLLCPEEY